MECVGVVLLFAGVVVTVIGILMPSRLSEAKVEGPEPYPLLRLDEAPGEDAPPDQWFDWIAAHAASRREWSEAAARAYRVKWGGWKEEGL